MDRKESRLEKSERSERRERDHDPDRKHKSSSRTHRSHSIKERTESKTSLSSTNSQKRSSMHSPVEEGTTISNAESRSRTSYPAFSKEHSKEAVGTRSAHNIFTPPSTDINASKEKLANLNRIINGPPSPPLTDKNAGRPKPSTTRSATVDTIVEEEKNDDSDAKPLRRSKTQSTRSNGNLRPSSENSSPSGRMRSKKEKTITPLKDTANGYGPQRYEPQRSVSQPTRTAAPTENDSIVGVGTIISSDATSVAPEQPSMQRPGSKVPLAAVIEDAHSQMTSTPAEVYSRQQTPMDIVIEQGSMMNTPSSMGGPPPPPPPPNVPVSIPRVDYLLQNGGLNHNVPRNLLYAGKPMAVQQATMSPSQPPTVVANLFEPYNQLLHDFEKVISKNGSLAVATGYRSVARRLLDRLEAVFARDLSSEYCTCRMCEYEVDHNQDIRGVSWGEILELVAGRRDLPSWPPFAFESKEPGLGISMDVPAPMQKLDIDVPEEYREHYIRQSRKIKQSVDRWLNRAGDDAASAPEEVDDETLTFAILTNIPSEQRPLFKELLGIVDQPITQPRRAPSPEHNQPPRPTPTPMPPKIRPGYIVAASLAIQRLYRLAVPPRDAETAFFLVANPSLHHPLATLAAVSNDEWDILISGRFDGFLRSGADDHYPDATTPSAYGRYTPAYMSRNPSRGATPAYGGPNSHSRKSSASYNHPRPATAPGYHTNFSTSDTITAKAGAPIALDEESEIQALAEIERDIYVGMEALEDAFEQLHLRAEVVRKAIRERSAGLAAAAQRRRTSQIEIRAGTPASYISTTGIGGIGAFATDGRWENETDDGMGDDISELAPDDSASNISSNRRRKHKRRNERRTPVVGAIDEESEDAADWDVEDGGASSPRKR